MRKIALAAVALAASAALAFGGAAARPHAIGYGPKTPARAVTAAIEYGVPNAPAVLTGAIDPGVTAAAGAAR